MVSKNKRAIIRRLQIVLRFTIVASCIALLVIFLHFIAQFVFPILTVGLLMLCLNPEIVKIGRKTSLPPRPLFIIAGFVCFSLAVGAFLIIAYPLIRDTRALSAQILESSDQLIEQLQTLLFSTLLPHLYQEGLMPDDFQDGIQETMRKNIENMADTLTDFAIDLLAHLSASLTQNVDIMPDIVFAALFVILSVSIFSGSKRTFEERLHTGPPPIQKRLILVIRVIRQTCLSFLFARLCPAALTFAVVYAGLLILRIDYPFTVAVLAGIIDLTPYLGSGMIFLPWITYQFFTHHYALSAGLTAIYTAILIQRQLFKPESLLKTGKIDPLASLFAMYAGFQWLGFSGLFIGPLTLIVMRTLHRTGGLKSVALYVTGKKQAGNAPVEPKRK